MTYLQKLLWSEALSALDMWQKHVAFTRWMRHLIFAENFAIEFLISENQLYMCNYIFFEKNVLKSAFVRTSLPKQSTQKFTLFCVTSERLNSLFQLYHSPVGKYGASRWNALYVLLGKRTNVVFLIFIPNRFASWMHRNLQNCQILTILKLKSKVHDFVVVP